MILIISTSTFIGLATVALIAWAGLVLWFTGRSKAKKVARPNPTVISFFQATAGKIAIDISVPKASYKRSELILLNQNGLNRTQKAISEKTPISETNQAALAEPALDDPAFAPADLGATVPLPVKETSNGLSMTTTLLALTTADESHAPAGFQLSLDRQLLSRLLSDDSLCEAFDEAFDEARTQTLERQRDTGRSYASLFREVIGDKPADVQAVLLNLLSDEEVDDFD